jgi:hypothetical protein
MTDDPLRAAEDWLDALEATGWMAQIDFRGEVLLTGPAVATDQHDAHVDLRAQLEGMRATVAAAIVLHGRAAEAQHRVIADPTISQIPRRPPVATWESAGAPRFKFNPHRPDA